MLKIKRKLTRATKLVESKKPVITKSEMIRIFCREKGIPLTHIKMSKLTNMHFELIGNVSKNIMK